MTTKEGTARRKRTAPQQQPTRLSLVEDTGATVTGQTARDDHAALHYALQFAARGIPVFPCNDRKEPILGGDWRANATTDPATIKAWAQRPACSAFAMPTGQQSGLVVVDIDPRHGGRREGHGLTSTYMVRTPSGGWHLHYHHDHEVRPNPKFALGVEVKGDGSYVILPGSRCRGKDEHGELLPIGTYRRTGRGSRPAPLPAHLAVPADRKPADGGSGAPGVVSTGSRHDTMVSFAGRLRYESRSVGEILEALTIYNERFCDPPKDAKEIAHIAESVAKYATGDDYEAALEKEVQRQKVQQEAREIVNRPARSFEAPVGQSMVDYLNDEEDPLEETIEGWHPTGSNTLINARAKTGKTVVADNLLWSLADGVPFLGKYRVRFSGRIATFDYEMTKPQHRDWLKRLGIVNVERVIPPWHLRGQPNPLLYPDECAAWLKDHGAGAWIIDTAARAYSDFVTDSNSESQMTKFLERVDYIKQAAGVRDLWMIAHAGVGTPDGPQRPRGSTRLDDWPDIHWTYKGAGSEPRYLSAFGRGIDMEEQELGFNVKTHHLTVVGSRSTTDEERWVAAVIDALTAADDPLNRTDLDSAVGSENKKGVAIAKARGYVIAEKVAGKNEKLHVLTDEGRGYRTRRLSKDGHVRPGLDDPAT